MDSVMSLSQSLHNLENSSVNIIKVFYKRIHANDQSKCHGSHDSCENLAWKVNAEEESYGKGDSAHGRKSELVSSAGCGVHKQVR